MRTDLLRHLGLWVFVSLAAAALMVAEATLQLGGRSAAIAICLLAPAAWATAVVCSSRRATRR
jgi:hypothetical protein